MRIPELATKLMNELTDCSELESCGIQFVELDTKNQKIIVSFDYADPETLAQDTIFCNY